MASFETSPGTVSDAESLVRLINLAFVAESPYVHGNRIDLPGVLEFFSKGEFFVLRNPETLVGCVFVGCEGRDGYVGLLSVDPAHQGKGLGTALMSAAEQACRAAGRSRVQLRFINQRNDLLRFYARLGYRDCGTLPFPYPARMKVPFHFIQMTKSLA
jgi:GNAT superfamily N-acetyltransferase